VTADPTSTVAAPPATAALTAPSPPADGSPARGATRGPLAALRAGGVLDLLVAQAVPLGVTFALTLVSAALLGPERRGVLTFLLTGSLLIGALGYGSLHVPVVDGLRMHDRSNLRHGIRLVAMMSGALAAGGVVVVVVGGLTHRGAGHGTATTVGLSMVGGAILVAELFAGRVLQGLSRNRGYQAVVVLQSLLYLAGATLVLTITRSPLLVFGAWAVSMLAGLALAATLLARDIRDRGPWVESAWTWRRFLRSATANNVGSIGQIVMLRADVLVVGVVVGPAAAGVYGLALSLTELALIVPEVFALSVYSSRSRLDGAEWAGYLRRTLRINTAVMVLSITAIAAAAVVLHLGPLADYDGLVLLVLIVLPGAVCAGYSRVALSGLQALGRQSRVWTFGVLALVLACGYVPASMLAGANGTAVMSTIAYAATGAYLWTSLRAALSEGPE
jgi:O-antigen/teichoic acid export membrane protein